MSVEPAAYRLVLDTNVLVSAALRPGSTPGRCLNSAIQQQHLILLTTETAQELAEVLMRAKFDPYVSTGRREAFLRTFLNQAALVEPAPPISACRDPRDNKFLEASVGGNATHLITGDRDLLVLDPFRQISIQTPADFLAQTFA